MYFEILDPGYFIRCLLDQMEYTRCNVYLNITRNPTPCVRTQLRYFETYNEIENISPRLAICKSSKSILYKKQFYAKKKKNST